MRNRPIQSKLRSRKGATLTLALMLLLVTSTVTAVALSTAVTTAKRERARRDTQQTLLTLQSAITMVRDQFTDSKAQIFEDKQGNGVPTITAAFTEGPLRSEQHPLSENVETWLKSAYQLDCADVDPGPIEVGSFTVSAKVDDEQLEDVIVQVRIHGNNHTKEESFMDFQIELIGTLADSDSSDQLLLKLDTDVYRSKTSRNNGTTITTRNTTEIYWRPEGD